MALNLTKKFLACLVSVSVFLPVPAASAQDYVAHIASDRSQPNTLRTFRRLKSKMPNILREVQPFVHKVDLGTKGVWYRLRVGPPMSIKTANNLCSRILNSGHKYCKVSRVHEVAGTSPGFVGEIIFKPSLDGRNMTLVEPFGYIDKQARKWMVPVGAVTDGASIPRQLWGIIGSPFVGKYRSAAVIHDHFVQTKYRSWSLTHNVFYDAMIAGGVSKRKALLMWGAVYRFGPRWVRSESVCWDNCSADNVLLESVEIFPDFEPNVFQQIRQYVSSTPTLSKSNVKKFVEETYFDPGKSYGATMRGYISGSVGVGGSRKEGIAYGSPERRHMNERAPLNWYTFGDSRYY